MVKKNILGTIGTTPMVRINRLCPNPNVKIFAKLEGFNPTGSIKDRIALRMIEAAERDGRLTPGKTIIEPTSGNTGIGLAIVGIVKGYPVEIVMSEAVSIERRKIIRSYGAKVILTPAEEGTDGAIRLARKKVADAPGRYFMPDQFANASNYLAHYQSTALEIWQQTGGNIDYLVCAIGTSGTLMGLSRFLKVMKPDIKVVCAQPIRGHYIQGLKNMEEAIVPDIYDPSQIDVQEMIESEEAISMAREIIRREAIFAGMSSGAAMLAAVRTAQKIERGNIVVVFPARAEKRTERLSRELTLTDAQAKQVYQLNLKDAQNAVQHRKEAEARREQMAAKWKTYQADRDAQMKRILTPEQYAKWSEMQQKMCDGRRGHFKGEKWHKGQGRMQDCNGQACPDKGRNRRNR